MYALCLSRYSNAGDVSGEAFSSFPWSRFKWSTAKPAQENFPLLRRILALVPGRCLLGLQRRFSARERLFAELLDGVHFGPDLPDSWCCDIHPLASLYGEGLLHVSFS